MGARLSTRCGRSQVKDRKVSIFELLLQLSKVGVTKDREDEVGRLFQQLFDIPIEDIPYETIEVYFQNFVLHNLLSANLSHGQICRYWECYAALLEYIVKRESVAADEYGADRSDSTSTNTTTSLASNTKNEVSILRASPFTRNGEGREYEPNCSKDSEFETLAGKEETHNPVGGSPSAANGICNTYESLLRGKCDVVRCLTPFVISKIFIRCLVASVNAVELLFHMEYLPYYLEWSSQVVFKLNAQDVTDISVTSQRQNVVHGDGNGDDDAENLPGQDQPQPGLEKENSNPSVEATVEECNYIGTAGEEDDVDGTSSEVAPSPCPSTFTSSQIYEENAEIIRTLRLRMSTEKEPINVPVNVDGSLESINNAIMEEALNAWSDCTTHALRRGFCFIDHRMRIFSLTCVVELLKRAQGAAEFMALPFCSVAYGGSERASHLQRLLVALHAYITTDITPSSTSHATFIKASQSMATDVLVILLSSIVMAPYVNTCIDKRRTAEISPMFTCIKNVPKTVRSVAPFYYIHVECVRSQLFVNVPSDLPPNAIEPVVDYFMKRDAPMIYASMDSLRDAIGSRGVEDMAWCLIRLLSTSPQNAWKRHLNVLRDNVTLLMLIMIGAGKEDVFLSKTEEMAERFKTFEYSTGTLSLTGSSQTDEFIEETEINISQPTAIPHKSLNNIHHSLLFSEQLPQGLMVAMAKALDNLSPSMTCSNELWLILIDMLSCDKTFASTFYLKPGSFIREVMSTIKKHSAMKKEAIRGKTSGHAHEKCPHHLVSRSPLIRTLVNILVHYIIHKKENYVDETYIDSDNLIGMIIAVFAWNIQTQKDHQLVNSLHLLVNELTPTHLVISRSTAENLLKNLHHWLSATGTAISAIRQEMIHADIARQNTLMLIQMVTAVLSIIKAALSPETLDKNMTLLHCIVNTCTMPPIEDLLFDIKDSKFDATSKLLGLEEMRPKTIELLEFLSLILRTFMGYKLNSMYELNNTKAGYGNHSVTLVVSNVIQEIYESDNQTKSALALAIIMDIEAPNPPPSPLTDVMQYHMSQIWIAAYRSQSRHTLWRYDLGKT